MLMRVKSAEDKFAKLCRYAIIYPPVQCLPTLKLTPLLLHSFAQRLLWSGEIAERAVELISSQVMTVKSQGLTLSSS